MSEYAAELNIAKQAVRWAARVCSTVQAEIALDKLDKQDKSPVTIADYASQALICRELQIAFPGDPVIGEEDARELRHPEQASFLSRIIQHLADVGVAATSEQACGWIDHGGATEYSPRFWTLDPIDGTKGFLRKEQYAVSLALIINGQLAVAALACPNLPGWGDLQTTSGSLFWAVAGGGAYWEPLDASLPAQRVCVSRQSAPSAWRFCESVESGHSKQDASASIAEQLGITQPPVRMDSQAKYGVVARGEADIYLRLPTRADYREKIWDHAGGVLITVEAGGTVTDVDGQPLDFTQGRELTRNRGVIVTSGAMHEEVLRAYAAASNTVPKANS